MIDLQAFKRPSPRLRRSCSVREIALTLAYALLGLLAMWPTSSMGTQISRLVASAVADSDAPEESPDSAEESGECGLPQSTDRRLSVHRSGSIGLLRSQTPDSRGRRLLRRAFTVSSGRSPHTVELCSRLRC